MSDPKSFPRGLLSLVLFLAGCTSTHIVPATGTGTTTSKVTGSVTYRERIALPPSAVVTVKLLDVSRADAPAELIAEQVIATPLEHAKCERCWHVREDVGANAEHPTLCGRCVSNLYGEGEARTCA